MQKSKKPFHKVFSQEFFLLVSTKQCPYPFLFIPVIAVPSPNFGLEGSHAEHWFCFARYSYMVKKSVPQSSQCALIIFGCIRSNHPLQLVLFYQSHIDFPISLNQDTVVLDSTMFGLTACNDQYQIHHCSVYSKTVMH